jgi:hypothetical protein
MNEHDNELTRRISTGELTNIHNTIYLLFLFQLLKHQLRQLQNKNEI